MLDNDRATMGGNNPPPFDKDVLEKHRQAADEFLQATQVWLNLPKIETDEHAKQMTDQIDGLRGLFKKVDAARKDAKAPHDTAGKAVQDAFTPILTKLKKASDALKPKLAEYASEQARIEQARKAEEERKAREEADAARKALAEAEAAGDIGASVDAEAALKEAEKAQKDATKKSTTSVKSATGAGRTMSLRTVKKVEITNVRVLFMHYQSHPDVADVLHRLATADVRAKDYDPEKPIPGIEIHEEKVMA